MYKENIDMDIFKDLDDVSLVCGAIASRCMTLHRLIEGAETSEYAHEMRDRIDLQKRQLKRLRELLEELTQRKEIETRLKMEQFKEMFGIDKDLPLIVVESLFIDTEAYIRRRI